MSVKFVKQPKYKVVDKTKEISQDSIKKIIQKLNLSTTNFKSKLQKLYDKSNPDSLVSLFGDGDVVVSVGKDKKTGGYLLNFSNLGNIDGVSIDKVKGSPEVVRKMSTGTASDSGSGKSKTNKSVVDKSLDKAEKLLKEDKKKDNVIFSKIFDVRGYNSGDGYLYFIDDDLKLAKKFTKSLILEAIKNGNYELKQWVESSNEVVSLGRGWSGSNPYFDVSFGIPRGGRKVIKVDLDSVPNTFKKFIVTETIKRFGVSFAKNKKSVKFVTNGFSVDCTGGNLPSSIKDLGYEVDRGKLKSFMYDKIKSYLDKPVIDSIDNFRSLRYTAPLEKIGLFINYKLDNPVFYVDVHDIELNNSKGLVVNYSIVLNRDCYEDLAESIRFMIGNDIIREILFNYKASQWKSIDTCPFLVKVKNPTSSKTDTSVPTETINLSNVDKYFYCPECDEYYGKSAEVFYNKRAGDTWRCSNCGEKFLLKGKLDW